MRQELFELSAELPYRTDKVNLFLDALMEATDTSLSVLLSVNRSDRKPEYRRITSRGSTARQDLGPLLGGVDVCLSWQPDSLEPIILPSAELGHDWNTLFHEDVLVLPLPGRPLGYRFYAPVPFVGILLVGPLPKGGFAKKTIEELLLATQTLLGVALTQWEIRGAYTLIDNVNMLEHKAPIDQDVNAMGKYVLSSIKKCVDFHTGVLYLRGLPSVGLSDYMVFAASIGEDHSNLLHSYWASEQLGITFKTMTEDKRTIAGKKPDMPDARRATNDHALKHVPGGVHGSWALMPFFAGERGVAVAHLEGFDNGRGITRTELEVLQILGYKLGETISVWQQTANTNPSLCPDLSLVEQLYEVQKYERNEVTQRKMFEDLVKRAFLDIQDVKLIPSKSSVRPDCLFQTRDKELVVIEATLSTDLTKKRRQILEYVRELSADLGILVIGNTYNHTNTIEKLDAYNKILLMDSERLMRFICLSPMGRSKLIYNWITTSGNGLNLANMNAL